MQRNVAEPRLVGDETKTNELGYLWKWNPNYGYYFNHLQRLLFPFYFLLTKKDAP